MRKRLCMEAFFVYFTIASPLFRYFNVSYPSKWVYLCRNYKYQNHGNESNNKTGRN